MKKLFFITFLLLMFTDIFGISDNRIDVSYELKRKYGGNYLIIYPTDDIIDAYAWLKSSNRVTKMGALSYKNRRCLILMPGDYNWTGESLILGTNYVDLYGNGDPSAILLRRTDGSVAEKRNAVEQTAFDVHITNIKFQSALYEASQKGHGLYLNAGNETTTGTSTHASSYCVIAATGIGVNIDWTRFVIDYEVYISVPGEDSGWYEPYYFNETYNNDNSLMVVGNPGESTGDVTCYVVYKKSIYKNLIGYSDLTISGGADTAASIWSGKTLVGKWFDCIANDAAWRTAQYRECRPYMVNCEAGNSSFAGDAENTGDGEISGTFINCIGGDNAFGGCGSFAIPCSGKFINCVAGIKSYGMSRECSGQFFNCIGGDRCFGGYLSSSYHPDFSGLAINCTAGVNSFAMGHVDNEISGTLINCRVGTLAESMAGTQKASVVTINGGKLMNCHPAMPTECTSNTNVYSFYSGHTYTNEGATGTVTLSLPPAKLRLEYNFELCEAQQFRIDPDGTETIAINGTQQGAGKYIVADAVGERCTLRCIIEGQWEQYNSLGTWTAEP